MSIVLGIDPGSRVTGYGLIEWCGNKVAFVDCGIIRPEDESLLERLHQIYHQVDAVIDAYRPACMAIEKVFVAKNADSALKLGHARGVAMLAGRNRSLSVDEYSARQVKLSVVGKGAAQKQQVQYMICKLLGLQEAPAEDAADALGIAICHALVQQGSSRVSQAIHSANAVKPSYGGVN